MSEIVQIVVCIVIGFVSFCAALVMSTAQIYEMVRTKNTSGTSVWTYVIFLLMAAIAFTWAMCFYFQHAKIWGGEQATLHQMTIVPILAYYFSDMVFTGTLVVIKTYHMHLAKALGKSELELSTYLLNKQRSIYAQTKKTRHHKYFGFAIYLTISFICIALFASLFAVYTRPCLGHVEPPFDDKLIIVLCFISAGAWEAVSWPQFIQCIRHKNTSGISIYWAIFLPLACTISFIYAILLATSTPGIPFDWEASGGVFLNGLIVNYGILIIKIKNMKAAMKHHLTEVEYTKKYIVPKDKHKKRA